MVSSSYKGRVYSEGGDVNFVNLWCEKLNSLLEQVLLFRLV